MPSSGAGGMASAKSSLKATARDAASQVKSAATSAADRVRSDAERFASDKKSATAERIGHYGSAIRESARSLEDTDPNIAWFTHQAADRLEHAADYLRNRDFSQLRNDTEEMARRHPALFFGGLFAAGLLLGTIMKSTSRRLTDSSSSMTGEEGTSDWAAATATPPSAAY